MSGDAILAQGSASTSCFCSAGGISAQTLQCDQGMVGNGILGEKCCVDVQPPAALPCCTHTLQVQTCALVPPYISPWPSVQRGPQPASTGVLRTCAAGKTHPAVRMTEPFFPSELGMQMLQK